MPVCPSIALLLLHVLLRVRDILVSSRCISSSHYPIALVSDVNVQIQNYACLVTKALPHILHEVLGFAWQHYITQSPCFLKECAFLWPGVIYMYIHVYLAVLLGYVHCTWGIAKLYTEWHIQYTCTCTYYVREVEVCVCVHSSEVMRGLLEMISFQTLKSAVFGTYACRFVQCYMWALMLANIIGTFYVRFPLMYSN